MRPLRGRARAALASSVPLLGPRKGTPPTLQALGCQGLRWHGRLLRQRSRTARETDSASHAGATASRGTAGEAARGGGVLCGSTPPPAVAIPAPPSWSLPPLSRRDRRDRSPPRSKVIRPLATFA